MTSGTIIKTEYALSYLVLDRTFGSRAGAEGYALQQGYVAINWNQ